MKLQKMIYHTLLLTMLLLCLPAAGNAYADTPSGPSADGESISQMSSFVQGPASVQSEADAAKTQGEELAAAEQQEQTQNTNPGIDPNLPMVALTFDDGPYPAVGNRIMDILEANQAKGTFFVVGNRIPAYRDEILRMKNNGHEVANHTQEHKYLHQLSGAQVQAQVAACSQAIAEVTGKAPALMRVPGGFYNEAVLAQVNLPVILWSIDPQDWKHKDASYVAQSILGQVKDGDIILLHELYPSTADAVEIVVPALKAQGYQLVTVSELAAHRGGAVPGVIYRSFRRLFKQ